MQSGVGRIEVFAVMTTRSWRSANRLSNYFRYQDILCHSNAYDFLLVSEQEIMKAIVWMIQHAHTLAEGAGAAPLAAAYKIRQRLVGKKVGLICSGGNLSIQKLWKALELEIND